MKLRGIFTDWFFFGIMVSFPVITYAQSGNLWNRSFNEESSLLSGAVVGGGAGPGAIYFNPASISEITASKFSLNASLFSFDFLDAQNALGEGIDLLSNKGLIEPRFISYMIESKRFKNWNFEVAFLNNENFWAEASKSVDKQLDILTGTPGDDRYYAFYQYSHRFRDDWMGAGTSVALNDKLSAGVSMFLTIKSLNYYQSLDIEAYPLVDSTSYAKGYESFYIAASEESDYLKFNDYRVTWKVGLLYQTRNLSLGLCVTTPSLGGIYSDGKKVTRREKQSNITTPYTGEPIPDYLIVDYQEKKDVRVASKTSLSIAAGMNYFFPDRKRTLYLTFEYFAQTQPYRLVEADESDVILPSSVAGEILFSEWLTYVSGAIPVFNVAVGYSWPLKKDLLLMGGFRTDFNNKKNLDYNHYTGFNKVESLPIDLYHITCGLSWKILGQNLITGIDYSLGHAKDQRQIANLYDPVEYNTIDNLALQGPISNTMKTWINSVSLYLGASLNWGSEKD